MQEEQKQAIRTARKYRYFLHENYKQKVGSSTTIECPEKSIINGIMFYIIVPYEVGSTAPSGLQEGGVYNILNRLIFESSRPDSKKMDINNIAIARHCTHYKGEKMPDPEFDLSVDGGAKELIIPLYIDLTQTNNPFSVYLTGANSYTQKYRTRLDWNSNMNGNGGIFTDVGNFAIDESNITIRYAFDQHSLPNNHILMSDPSGLFMRNLNQVSLSISQTQYIHDTLQELRDYIAIHMIALKKNNNTGQISATDELFNDFDEIAISNSTGSNRQTFLASSWYDLKHHTVNWFKSSYDDIKSGYRSLSFIDNHRMGQMLKVASYGDVNVNFDKISTLDDYDTSLDLTYEYLTKQD